MQKNKPSSGQFEDIYSSSGSPSVRSAQKKPKRRQTPLPLTILKKFFAGLGKALLGLFLVCVITGCIVVTVLTVYVMRFVDTDSEIDLTNMDLNYTTKFYAYGEYGQPVEVAQISMGGRREWAYLEDIPQHLKDAVVYSEDKRFYDHEGVDFKRTFSAFANLVLEFFGAGLYDTTQGGSTITQQVVKNVTGDDETQGFEAIERKVREIFRAMNLEKEYSKDQILEVYLNIVPMGNLYGMQAAAEYYFNKDVSDLTIVESAALAAMIKSPSSLNPYVNEEGNKERRDNYVLPLMREYNCITEAEYQEALAVESLYDQEEPEGSDQEEPAEEEMTAEEKIVNAKYNSWFVDHVYEQVVEDLMEEKGYEREYAEQELKSGGYRIYTTMDIELQAHLEEKYKDEYTFSASPLADPPQSAAVIMDYNGKILALVGGRGEKDGDFLFNRATQSKRSPGSSIKPLSVYSLAVEKNMVNWSTMILDAPIKIMENGQERDWPYNYGRQFSNQPVPIYYAIYRSLNTVPARLGEALTPQVMLEFLRDQLGFTTLVETGPNNDYSLSPLCLGSLTDGVRLLELTAAYQIFGNGGKYYEPYCYTKVTDTEGNTILQPSRSYRQVISEDTAGVMNRLLQQVIIADNGCWGNAVLYHWSLAWT